MDTTVACLRCGTTISVPATDRHGVIELLGDFGWQASRKDGAFAQSTKCGPTKTLRLVGEAHHRKPIGRNETMPAPGGSPSSIGLA